MLKLLTPPTFQPVPAFVSIFVGIQKYTLPTNNTLNVQKHQSLSLQKSMEAKAWVFFQLKAQGTVNIK